MDRGIKPVIVLSAEILMNFWYTLESCNQKGQMTQLKQGRDPQPPHPHTHLMPKQVDCANGDGRNHGGIKGLFKNLP